MQNYYWFKKKSLFTTLLAPPNWDAPHSLETTELSNKYVYKILPEPSRGNSGIRIRRIHARNVSVKLN